MRTKPCAVREGSSRPAAKLKPEMLGELGHGTLSCPGAGRLGRDGDRLRAFDERLQRQVAVKEIAGADARRVLREAQAAARLNHPGIVTLYELGSDDGRALLVSELVEGSTLAELARPRVSAIARSRSSARTSARRWPTPTVAG